MLSYMCKNSHLLRVKNFVKFYYSYLLYQIFLYLVFSFFFLDVPRLATADGEIIQPEMVGIFKTNFPNIFLDDSMQLNYTTKASKDRKVIRSRSAHVNFDALIKASKKEIHNLRFNLFENINLIGTVTRSIIRSAREFTLHGAIDNDMFCLFTLTINEDALVGYIQTSQGVMYEIRYSEPQVYEICELDISLFPLPSRSITRTDPLGKVLETNDFSSANKVSPESDDGSIIDVMVIYTPAARLAKGGKLAIEAVIDQCIDQTNIIFENSQIYPRIRLAHQQEIAYSEVYDATGDLDDRQDFYNIPEIPGVQSLMDTFGADRVCLLSVGGGKGAVMWPYFLIGQDIALPYGFTHELGHALGCAHGIGDSWGSIPPGTQHGDGHFYYSHGWHLFVNGNRKCTVMAYASPGWQFNSWGETIPYFSNPDVDYMGVPTGSRVNGVDEANNVRSINEMAESIANHHSSIPFASSPSNVLASDGSYPDRIEIQWDAVDGATHYRVYRSEGLTNLPEPLGYWSVSTEFSDYTAEPWVTYTYWVRAAKSSTGSLASDFVFSRTTTGWRKLAAPISIWATDGDYIDKVKVSWISASGATHYRVLRSDSENGLKEPISEWQTERTFDDTTAAIQKNYYYWVQSALSDDGWRYSDISDNSDHGWRAMAPPHMITATKGQFPDKVSLTWTLSEGASYNCVYRSDSIEGQKEQISEWIPAANFVDTQVIPGKTYYYWMRYASNSSGFDGTGYSDYTTGWAALYAPDNVQASDGVDDAKIYVSWSALNNNIRYRVYRSEQSNVSESSYLPLSDWQLETNYEDISASPGVDYYYYVKAALVGYESNAIAFSEGDAGWRKIKAPTHVIASDAAYVDKIRITWQSDEDAGDYFYRVTRSPSFPNSNQPGWTYNTLSYEDTSIEMGQTYHYWVSAALDSNGTRASDLSNPNSGSIGLTPPVNVRATDGEHPNKVVVEWDLFEGTYYYQISRSESFDGEKTALTGWDQQTNQYEDYEAEEEKLYYYWVKASTNMRGFQASAYSESDIGYRSLPTPTGLELRGYGPYALMFKWIEVMGASHYRLYRKDSPDSEILPVSNWISETEYTDEGLISGHTYYYYVKAAGSAAGAGESDYSALLGCDTLLLPPENIAASNGTFPNNVRITWTSVPSALYFMIIRSESPERYSGDYVYLNNYERISSFSDLTAESGKIYYYTVVGARSQSGYGATSLGEFDAGWVSPPVPGRPYPSAGEYDDKIVITWDPIADGIYYQLYRAQTVDGERTPLGGWTLDTSFEDTNVDPGPNYYYWLKSANNSNGDGASDFSIPYGGWRGFTPPQNIYASQGTEPDMITIRWDKVEGAFYYRVYRSNSLKGEKTSLGGWQREVRFNDITALGETVYYYWIRAAKGITGYGATDYSESAVGWIKLSAPSQVSASDGIYQDKVKVTWIASRDQELYYKVFRSNSIDGDKTSLSDWLTSLTYDDIEAELGITYYYWVKSSLLKTGEGPSDFSKSDTGWLESIAPEIPVKPDPADDATQVSVKTNLDWADCVGADTYQIRLWKSSSKKNAIQSLKPMTEIEPEPELGGLRESFFDPPKDFEANTTYSWQVIAVNRGGKTEGPVWTFTTGAAISSSPTTQPTNTPEPIETPAWPTSTMMPSPTVVNIKTPFITPTPTATVNRIPTNKPTPTITPSVTQVIPKLSEPTPVYIYRFDQLSLEQNGFREIPGGFSGMAEGEARLGEMVNYDANLTDGHGVFLTCQPGEVSTLISAIPISVGNCPVVIRTSIWANSAKGQAALAVLDGNMNGSLGTSIPTTTHLFDNTMQRFSMMYEPTGSDTVSVVIQLYNPATNDHSVSVFWDNIEVIPLCENYAIEPEFVNFSAINSNMDSVSHPYPSKIYTLNEDTFEEAGFSEVPGGFAQLPAGESEMGTIPLEGSIGGDGRGAILRCDPGENQLLIANPPIFVGQEPVIIKLIVRASSPLGQVALVALDGNLSGSLATFIPIDTSRLVGAYNQMTLLYQPTDSNLIAPVIQLYTPPSASEPVIAYLDEIQVIPFSPGTYINARFMSISDYYTSMPDPTPTNSPTSRPSFTICESVDEYFQEEMGNMIRVNLNEVYFEESRNTDGTPIRLRVSACSRAGLLGVFIPLSAPKFYQKATIRFRSNGECEGLLRRHVAIDLLNQTPAVLYAFGENAKIVDTVELSTNDNNDIQNIELRSDIGIRWIELEGENLCILRVCCKCDQ